MSCEEASTKVAEIVVGDFDLREDDILAQDRQKDLLAAYKAAMKVFQRDSADGFVSIYVDPKTRRWCPHMAKAIGAGKQAVDRRFAALLRKFR